MRTSELAKLAWPDMPQRDAVARLHRWRQAGIIDAAGKEPGGAKASFFYEHSAAAAVSVVGDLYLRHQIDDAKVLGSTYRFLTEPQDGAHPRIDIILDAILRERDPLLVLTRWRHIADEQRLHSFAIRYAEAMEPISYPSAQFEFVGDIVIDLAPLLARFVGANIVELSTH